ncbi:Serine/threonine-protein kinase PknD [compost metagenome]
MIGTDGVTRTLAGSTCGTSDGNGPAASFQVPAGVALTGSGALFVADSGSDRLRVVASTGAVTTLAGQDNWKAIIVHLDEGTTGVVLPNGTEIVQPKGGGLGWIDYADGAAEEAKFNDPRGVVVDHQGNLLVADTRNGVVRCVEPAGNVRTLKVHRSGEDQVARWPGREVKEDRLGQPIGLAIAADGSLYVSESSLSRVSRIAPDGEVHVIAGGRAGCSDGLGADAQFNEPAGLAIGPDGHLYVADSKNHRICRITAQGLVQTVAGGACGYRDGRGEQARFNEPWGLAFDTEGNLLVSDRKNHAVRKLIMRPRSPIAEPEPAPLPNEAVIIYAEAQDEAIRRKLAPFGVRLDRWDQLPGRRIRAITEQEAWSNAILLHFDDAWVEIEGFGTDPFPYFKDELRGQDIHFHPSHLHGRIITSVIPTYERQGGDVAHVRFRFDDGTEQWLEPYYGSGLRIS